MQQRITGILVNLTDLFNASNSRQKLGTAGTIVLLVCLPFLLFGTGTHSKSPSARNTAVPPIFTTSTIPPTKWWSKKTITPSSTSSSISSAIVKPVEESASDCLLSSSSRLQPGIYAYISLTPPLPNRVRAGAGKTNAYLGQIQPGSGVKIIDGPLCADGLSWWLVEAVESGLQGWTATGSNSEQWVLPCPNPAIVCKMTPVSIQSAPTTAPLSTQNNKKDTCNSELLSIGVLNQVEQGNLLVIRAEPYIGSVIGHAGPTSAVTIVGGPTCAGGAVWWEVNVASLNLTGWAIETNLRACSKEDGCT